MNGEPSDRSGSSVEDGTGRCRHCGAALPGGSTRCSLCVPLGETLVVPKHTELPDIVITAAQVAELGNVAPARPLPTVSLPAQEPSVSRPVSRLAIVSLILAGLGAGALVSLQARPWPLLGGLATTVVALALSTLALILMGSRRTRRGALLAVLGAVVACVGLVAGVLRVEMLFRRDASPFQTGLDLEDLRPPTGKIAKLPQPTQGALRANVLIRRDERGLLSSEQVWGSGVVTRLDADRVFILSNRHVVGPRGGDDKIEVVFYDGLNRPAKVEWVAPDEVDLAFVSTPREGLAEFTPPRLRAEIPEQGARVFAVGNPLNLAWSYTEGVISGLRVTTMGHRAVTVLQTQAPINYGNSGGGLYSMQGELIGINTWTGSKVTSEGLGFAIASATVLECLDSREQSRFLSVFPPTREPQ